MADEPGILDVINTLFGEPEGYHCQSCNNSKAVILTVCSCGWKFQGCLACLLMDASKNAWAMADAFKTHKAECESLARLVRIAEAAAIT